MEMAGFNKGKLRFGGFGGVADELMMTCCQRGRLSRLFGGNGNGKQISGELTDLRASYLSYNQPFTS